jgi:hypothetical protein
LANGRNRSAWCPRSYADRQYDRVLRFHHVRFFRCSYRQRVFPSNNATASLLLSVATFGLGFLTRPIGAVVIGAYADRAGRKPALLLTVALMSLGTYPSGCSRRKSGWRSPTNGVRQHRAETADPRGPERAKAGQQSQSRRARLGFCTLRWLLRCW